MIKTYLTSRKHQWLPLGDLRTEALPAPLFLPQSFVGPPCILNLSFKGFGCVTKKLHVASKVESVKVNVKFQPGSLRSLLLLQGIYVCM